mmetsp:Transcript_12254/g.25340  ORF Transcript_12254/g.25340 Transcript_12254/m.25340 type:complete len:87 (+) Transcript_12254:132-392(+)
MMALMAHRSDERRELEDWKPDSLPYYCCRRLSSRLALNLQHSVVSEEHATKPDLPIHRLCCCLKGFHHDFAHIHTSISRYQRTCCN